MNRQILEKPFENHQIKQRRGHGGKMLSYVEGAEYIQRLNEAFEGQWSFEIVDHQILAGEVVVIGKLSAEGIVKTSFGGSSITTSNHTGEAIGLADDLKSAATDALKKASSMLGIGLHLYNENVSRDSFANQGSHLKPAPVAAKKETAVKNTSSRNTKKRAEPKSAPKKATVAKTSAKQTSAKGALTERQLNAILAISRTVGWSKEVLKQHSIENFGVPPNELTKNDASNFIDELRNLANHPAANRGAA